MPPSTRRIGLACAAPVLLHGFEQIARLVADGFERRLRQFLVRRAARQAEERAARLGIPVGRTEPDEGRHEIDLLVADRRTCASCARFGRRLDQLQAVAQPLHGSAGDEDRAFQRIGALAVELIGDGGQQPVLRGHGRAAGVEQRKAAGAIGRFHHAGLEAGLADGRGLLVARHTANRNGRAQTASRRSRRSRRRSPSPPAAGCAAR